MINNYNNIKQVVDFQSLKEGNKLATDIDCFIEYYNKLFIFLEFKYYTTNEIPLGQRIALERLCDVININARAFILVCSHSFQNNKKILIDQTEVITYRYKTRWIEPKQTIKTTDAINILKDKYLKNSY